MFSWFRGKPAKSPELKEAETVYTTDELTYIQKQFQDALAHQGGPGAGRGSAQAHDGALDVNRLGALLGPAWPCLDPLIASRLQWLLADRADGRVHLSSLIIAKARAERLGEQASLEFSYGLMNADGKGVGHRALEAAVLSCLRLTGAAPRPAEAASDPRVTGSTPACSSSSTETTKITSTQTRSSVGGGGARGGGGGAGGGSSSDNVGASSLQIQVAAISRGALAHAAAAGAASGGGQATEDVRLSYSEYCQWTKKCPAVHKTLCALMRRLGAPAGAATPAAATAAGAGGCVGPAGSASAAAAAQGSDPLRLPALLQLGKLPVGATLLQPAWMWALASRLPPAQRCEWRLLFSSQRDGKSFNTFFGRVSAAPGPTLMLIRDQGGALFGGYASQPWAKSGVFYGDVSCFIFSLLPAMQVFPATGINDNLQWCGVGFSQLPGGLGFGGAAAEGARGHFALYVQPSLDSGMSRPIATYGNTPLASEQVFQIDMLECWLLHQPEEEPGTDASGRSGARGGGGGGGGSILSKAAEDRAIMELAGMKLHSAGMVEEPLEED